MHGVLQQYACKYSMQNHACRPHALPPTRTHTHTHKHTHTHTHTRTHTQTHTHARTHAHTQHTHPPRHHEDMSERILDHLVDANALDLGATFGERRELGLVKDLMRGTLAGGEGAQGGGEVGGRGGGLHAGGGSWGGAARCAMRILKVACLTPALPSPPRTPPMQKQTTTRRPPPAPGACLAARQAWRAGATTGRRRCCPQTLRSAGCLTCWRTRQMGVSGLRHVAFLGGGIGQAAPAWGACSSSPQTTKAHKVTPPCPPPHCNLNLNRHQSTATSAFRMGW